jgi:plasmid stabilization system protein ParE
MGTNQVLWVCTNPYAGSPPRPKCKTKLKSFPVSGLIVPEINSKDFRELIYGNYRIIYRVEKTQISILTIRHGKQMLPIDEIHA